MAICRPLTVPRRLSKMARAGWALVAIWICSVLFSLPWLYYNKVRVFYFTEHSFKKVLSFSGQLSDQWIYQWRNAWISLVCCTMERKFQSSSLPDDLIYICSICHTFHSSHGALFQVKIPLIFKNRPLVLWLEEFNYLFQWRRRITDSSAEEERLCKPRYGWKAVGKDKYCPQGPLLQSNFQSQVEGWNLFCIHIYNLLLL